MDFLTQTHEFARPRIHTHTQNKETFHFRVWSPVTGWRQEESLPMVRTLNAHKPETELNRVT